MRDPLIPSIEAEMMMENGDSIQKILKILFMKKEKFL